MSLPDRPFVWSVTVAGLTLVCSILFWAAVVVGIGWNLLRVPIGLGGALYPKLFAVPVLLGTLAYVLVIATLLRPRSRRAFVWLSLGVPLIVAPALLVAFCPMDSDESFLLSVLGRLF